MPYGSYSIPAGDAGTQTTLNYMASLATQAAVTPVVRGVAAQLVLGIGRRPMMHAEILSEWVAKHCEFLPDPTVAEALMPPWDALAMIARQGLVQCDCDDVAMLAAALGLSIGLRARFVVVAFAPGPTAPFAHVFTELAGPSGTAWLTVDPTRPMLGMPTITRSLVMEV